MGVAGILLTVVLSHLLYSRSGYTQECDSGFHGDNCTLPCSENCKGSCNTKTGFCLNGCLPGYVGDQCDKECDVTFYGVQCQQQCNSFCLNSDCHHVTGVCKECPPGKSGDQCEDDCSSGTYGHKCANTCSKNCQGLEGCDLQSGECKSGCTIGYEGAMCEKPCENKTFGEGCKSYCSQFCAVDVSQSLSVCHHISGECRLGCISDHEGPMCAKLLPAKGPEECICAAVIVGLVIAFVVQDTLIVIGVLIWRRLRHKMDATGKKTPHIYQNYPEAESVRTFELNSAATMPDNAVTGQANSSDYGYEIAINSAQAKTQNARQLISEDNVTYANDAMANPYDIMDDTMPNVYEDTNDV